MACRNVQTVMSRKANISDKNRRYVLQAMGGAALAGLAGCVGGDSGGRGDGTWDVAGFNENPPNLQYNPYNPTSYGGANEAEIYDLLVWELRTEGDREPNVAEDWTLDGDTFTVQIREQTWHDGDDVTAEDVAAHYWMGEYFDYPEWRYLDSVEVTGDREVTFNLQEELNEEVIVGLLLDDKRVDTKYDVFEEYLDDLEGASDGDEEDEILGEVVEMTIDDPVGNTLWEMDDWSESGASYALHDGHPLSDDIDFEDVYKHFASETRQKQEFAISNDADAVHVGWSQTFEDQLGDSWFTTTYPTPDSTDLAFDHSDDVWGRREARKAIAYLMDDETLVSNADRDGTWVPEPVPTGYRGDITVYLDEDDLSGFTDYSREANSDYEAKAESLMQEAGFTKEGGQWLTEDGDQVEAPISAPAVAPTIAIGETVVDTLNQFGISAELNTVEAGTFLGSDWDEGNYTIGLWLFRPAPSMHPFFSYEAAMTGVRADANNFPSEVDVPWPPGEPDGDEQTIDLDAKIQELGASDENEAQLIRELAWVSNQVLPTHTIGEHILYNFYRGDTFDVPDEDDPILSIVNGSYRLHNTGQITERQ